MAYSQEWAIWVATIVIGWGMGTLFPAAISWISHYIEITFIIGSMFFIAGSFAEIIVPTALLMTMEKVPQGLYYHMAAASVVSTLLYTTLGVLFRKFDMKDRFLQVEEPEVEGEPPVPEGEPSLAEGDDQPPAEKLSQTSK